MDKLMLCLANSYKCRGRCIAGIELTKDADNHYQVVRHPDGRPKWIRPVSHTAGGEISSQEAANISIMSVVSLRAVEEASMYAHSENVHYSQMLLQTRLSPTEKNLDVCVDKTHFNIFGNRGRAVIPDDFKSGDYSLMLIKTVDAEIYIDTRFAKCKERIRFVFHGHEYDFPITDPIYLDKLAKDASLNRKYDLLYLVVSLGIEHDGWHSKLVTTIIEPSLAKIVQRPVKNTPIQKKEEVPTVSPSTCHTQEKKIEGSSMQKSNLPLSSPQNSKKKQEGCYIATMIYGSYDAEEVIVLRNFRDKKLLPFRGGRFLVRLYYKLSPRLVTVLRDHDKINAFLKRWLDIVVANLKTDNSRV